MTSPQLLAPHHRRRLRRRLPRRPDRRRRRLADDAVSHLRHRRPAGAGGRHRPAVRLDHQGERGLAPPRARQRQLADRALAGGGQPARRARHARPGSTSRRPTRTLLAALIRKVLAGALVVSALAVASLSAAASATRCARPTPPCAPGVRRVPTLLLGLVLGVLVTLTSVGAGAIGVVVLTALYHALSARRLVGTDIVHAIPLTFLAGIEPFRHGQRRPALLGILLVGSVPGIALGSRITGLVPDWFLRVALALVLLWAAYSLRDDPSTRTAADAARPQLTTFTGIDVGVERVAGRRRLARSRRGSRSRRSARRPRAPWRSARRSAPAAARSAPCRHPRRRAC